MQKKRPNLAERVMTLFLVYLQFPKKDILGLLNYHYVASGLKE